MTEVTSEAFPNLSRSLHQWRTLVEDSILSIYSNIPRTALAEMLKNEIIELGNELNGFMMNEETVRAISMTSYKKWMKTYLEAIDNCVGLTHEDKTRFKTAMTRILQNIGLVKGFKPDDVPINDLDDVV